MNGAAISPARALVRANPRRLSASRARAVARLRLLSAAAALTGVTTRDFVVALLLSLSLSLSLSVSLSLSLSLALSLSRSVLLRLHSYARVVSSVLAPAEASGIRNTVPPNKEIGWDGCAK